jgi:hypothetical protein
MNQRKVRQRDALVKGVPAWLKRIGTAAAIATAVSLATPGSASAASYSLSDPVRMRNEPTAGSAYSAVAPRSAIIEVNCQQWGEAQGPNGNTLWLNVNGSGRSGWWVNDAWTTSPHLAADKAVGIAGVRFCNQPAPSDNLPAPSRDTKVWVGAPFAGAWAGSARSLGSLPQNHNPVFGMPGHNWVSDWAMDYYAIAGTPVKLFAAPKDNRLNDRITARVLDVRPTCAPRAGERLVDQVARGGYAVFVGIFDGDMRVGTIAYGHVNPAFSTTYRGGLVRWGGDIGTVGRYARNSCWDVGVSTGHHVHLELSNESPSLLACYRPGVPQNATLAAKEYVGYLGGAFATARKQACPSGA